MTTPRDLLDDKLSHEPDFSFRDKKPAHFSFDHTATDDVNLDAVAKLSPNATPTPLTEPINIIEQSPAPTAQIPTHMQAPPAQPAPIIPQVQVIKAPFSGVSLASFILSLAGLVAPFFFMPVIFSLLAVILGHIGSYRSKKHMMNGAGFAAAGITIGYATLAITALVAIVVIIIAVLSGNVVHFLQTRFR